VAGLPKPRRNHAVVMAKFAQEILQAMKVATFKLDSQLGPGTAELAVRIGLNSGPTTGKLGILICIANPFICIHLIQ
jgi:hypothetical protein